MKKVFSFYDKLSKREQRTVYKLYSETSTQVDSIHNFATPLLIPTSVKICLKLGLKFSYSQKPNFNQIYRCANEGIRKISWQVFYFNKNENGMTETERIIHNIKKVICPSHYKCPLEPFLFSRQFANNFTLKMRNVTQKHSKIHEFLLNDLKEFVTKHDLIIRQSDKNAGICVMRRTDYNTEVFRQLQDEQTYRPSVFSEYSLKMNDFSDKVRYLNNWLFQSLKIKRILPLSYSPAKFYILPKIHKSFDKFPVGRPISSTIKCINKGISMLLDKILQPLSLFVPDLLIDSPHLLLLLQHIKLDPGKKYILITADINSMYLELPINVCKQNCLKFFRSYSKLTKLPFPITEEQFKTLLDLSLDYSFLEYQNDLYFQHRGIQMGNSASVSVANITAAVELENMKSELLVFKGRFIDDIILILEISSIEVPISEWLNTFFRIGF